MTSSAFAEQGMLIQLGAIQYPGISSGPARLFWGGNGKAAQLAVKNLVVSGERFPEVSIQCAALTLFTRQVSCKDGSIVSKSLPASWQPLKFAITYDVSGVATVAATIGNGKLSLQYSPNKKQPNITAQLQNLPVSVLQPFVAASQLQLSSGDLSGKISWQLADGQTHANITVSKLAFGDESGNKAAQEVTINSQIIGKLSNSGWQGNVNINWSQGELYFAPYYAKTAPDKAISFNGDVLWDKTNKRIQLNQGSLTWPGLGAAALGMTFVDSQLDALSLKTKSLSLASSYQTILKPLLTDGGLLSDLEVQGKVDLSVDFSDKKLKAIDLSVHQLFAEDKNGRIAIYDLNGVIPWRANGASTANLRLNGGKVLGLPVDDTSIAIKLKGDQLEIPTLDIPLMGGHFSLSGLKLKKEQNGWSGGVAGEIKQVSMPKMSAALGWPTIEGELSASLPRIVFDPIELKAYGPIELDLFDGVSFLRNLKLTEPFGRAPRFTADLEMQNLDLGKLTKTFSFGAIEGKLDVTVDDLTLVDWQVTGFDAKVQNSPGDYRKRISQKAVENIGELGGAGFSGALQRSFLRFFDSFGYSKLGWSCKLVNNVCHMTGIADAPNGYYLVVGGGVPAINVIGFNQSVHWSELLARIKRITEGGKPVMQ